MVEKQKPSALELELVQVGSNERNNILSYITNLESPITPHQKKIVAYAELHELFSRYEANGHRFFEARSRITNARERYKLWLNSANSK